MRGRRDAFLGQTVLEDLARQQLLSALARRGGDVHIQSSEESAGTRSRGKRDLREPTGQAGKRAPQRNKNREA